MSTGFLICRQSVYKLMTDPELPYYTKAPTDTFIVAIDRKLDQVVGCVAGSKMGDRDSMELHRLIVRPDLQVIKNLSKQNNK